MIFYSVSAANIPQGTVQPSADGRWALGGRAGHSQGDITQGVRALGRGTGGRQPTGAAPAGGAQPTVPSCPPWGGERVDILAVNSFDHHQNPIFLLMWRKSNEKNKTSKQPAGSDMSPLLGRLHQAA